MFDFVSIKEAKTNISEWCRLLRKSAGVSQQELADELVMSRITISKLENGENFTIETLLKVLQHFDQIKAFNEYILSRSDIPESLY